MHSLRLHSMETGACNKLANRGVNNRGVICRRWVGLHLLSANHARGCLHIRHQCICPVTPLYCRQANCHSLLSRNMNNCAGHGDIRFFPTHASMAPQARRLSFRRRPSLPYDALSIDIGITPGTGSVPGALEHTTPVKPINRRVIVIITIIIVVVVIVNIAITIITTHYFTPCHSINVCVLAVIGGAHCSCTALVCCCCPGPSLPCKPNSKLNQNNACASCR